MNSKNDSLLSRLDSILGQIKVYESLIPSNNIQAHTLLDYFKNEMNGLGQELKDLNFEATGENPLTKREMEVLILVAEGQPNKEIAYKLGISQKTVQFHMKSIFRKLEVGSRTEATTEAIKRGILTI